MARLPLRSIYPFTRCQPIKQGEQNGKTGKNLCDSHDVTSTTDCLCRNESKDITVSGTRNIPTPPFLSHGGKIGNYTWTYPPNYHPSLLERQRWGWSQAFSSKLFTNVVFTRYRYIYTRTPSTHGKRSDVFITARNALSTEYHFRGTSYTATSLVLCLSALVALTRATPHHHSLLRPTLPTYLLHQRSALEKSRGWCSFDFSRGLSWKAGNGPIFGRFEDDSSNWTGHEKRASSQTAARGSN